MRTLHLFPVAVCVVLMVCMQLHTQPPDDHILSLPDSLSVPCSMAPRSSDDAARDSALLRDSDRVLRQIRRRQADRIPPGQLRELGRFRFNHGDMAEAEVLLNEAATRFRDAGSATPPIELAQALVLLGRCCTELGKYEEAQGAMEDAVVMYRKLYRRVPRTEYAGMLRAAARASFNRGAYTKAVIRFNNAFKMRRRIAGGQNTPELAESLVDLAEFHLYRGSHARAYELLVEGGRVLRQVLDRSDSPDLLRWRLLVAWYRHLRGQERKSTGTFMKAVATFERLRPCLPGYRIGRWLVEFGVLSRARGDTGTAQAQLLEAIDTLRRVYGSTPTFDRARAAGLLADIAVARGDRAGARAWMDDATAMYNLLCGERDHPDRAAHLCVRAAYYALGRRWKQADSAFADAAAMFHRLYARTGRLDLALGILKIGRLAERYGMDERVAGTWRDLLRVLPLATRESGTFEGEEGQILLRMHLSEGAATLARYYLKRGAAAELLELSLWQKGRVLASVEWRNRVLARLRRDDSGTAALWKRYVDLRRYGGLEAGSVPISYGNVSGQDIDSMGSVTEQLAAMVERMEDSLTVRSAELKTGRREITWKGIANRLKKGDCAVDFLRVARENVPDSATCYALILRSRSTPVVVRLCEEHILHRILRVPVAAPGTDVRSYVHDAYRGAELYRAVWAPLERLVKGARRIYISPDGELNRVAFGALRDSTGRMLCELFDIRYRLSLRDLVPEPAVKPWKEKPSTTDTIVKRRTAAVFGGVPYLSDRVITWDDGALRPLAASGAEADAVATMLKEHGFTATSYLGGQATGEAFLRLESPTVLHVAAHGYVLADSGTPLDGSHRLRLRAGRLIALGLADPLLRSGLLLAGAGSVWADDSAGLGPRNGVVTAYDIASMDLTGTELAVLSACETGLGDIMAGEGVMGLKRAFRAAGVRAVMISLWKVPDMQTRELMEHFYANWLEAGMEKGKALNEAQLRMARKGADPYYWGAFVLVGE